MILEIKTEGLFCEAIFFCKCLLGLPVVHKVYGVVSMKSIDMYILHDSSLVVSFSNILAYFVFTLQSSHKR